MKKDWLEIEIGAITQINMGQSPPSSTYNDDGIGLPFFQGKAEFTELHPKVKKWCSVPNKIAEKEDILLSVRAPVGSTNVADTTCAIGRGLAAIRYQFGYKYIWYYLKLVEKKLDSLGTGTTFKAISGQVLKSYKMPLSPLPEQRAIVSRIEELFSELDHSVSNLKSAQAKLEIYRQAVLKKAFEGGFSRQGNSDGWKCVKLGEIVENLSQGWSPKCLNEPSKDPEEWAVIKTSAIQHGRFVEEANKILPNNLDARTQHEIKVGDILITRAGPRDRVGVCCEVRKTRPKLINCDKVYRIRLKDSVHLSYFMLKMNSVEFINKIESIKWRQR